MSLCIVCGGSNPDRVDMCSYHCTTEDGWAAGNRIMCDFVHRAIVPPRLAPAERDEIADVDGLGEVLVCVDGSS